MTAAQTQIGLSEWLCSGEYPVQILQPEDVRRLAPVWGPLIQPALDRTDGRVDLQVMIEAAEKLLMQIWLGWEKADPESDPIACWATEVLQEPIGIKVARVVALGSNGRVPVWDWAPTIQKVEVWATLEGCRALEIVGRPGWGRIYPGYRPIHTTFVKELSP